jgi:hypothetical protein
MFDSSTIFVSMIWSSIGVGYFIYGKKQQSISALAGGIALNVLAYLCESPLTMSLASLGTMALVYFLIKREN